MADKETRVNPETGVVEQYNGRLLGWGNRQNENGKVERINPQNGVLEEYDGRLYGWRRK
jgi:hypothetical protein